MKKVICCGTFDILHPGHLNYFKQAKEYGDYLIVVVARDKTVLKVKGKLPLNNEKERLKLVKDIKIVNEAVLGNLKDKLKVIKDNKPDFVCLGYDQSVDKEKLKEDLAKVNIFPKIKRMKAYLEKKYKSSLNKNPNHSKLWGIFNLA